MDPTHAVDNWTSPDAPSAPGPPSSRSAIPETGSVVEGGYRILSHLGTGSMGIVVLAHDELLDRRVAIKFTHPDLFGPTFRARFLDEARAMARFSHPNVLQVYAFGVHVDIPYIVMEYVDGCTLEQWLADRSTPPPLDDALRILDDVCAGVAAIHAGDTVHHDIKPSNILLDRALRPRVADLGLAALCRRDQPAELQVVGTPAYMAPEIVLASLCDPALRSRADVYSLACVSYQVLTGSLPFHGSGNICVLLQHATKPIVRPSTLRPGLPEQLDRALLGALAKDPAMRTPTVEAFRRELASARKATHEPTRILVAEDDDDCRESLKLLLALEFPNAEIECVEDGCAALEAFERNPPSVSILDLRMPGIDGMVLTRLFRERLSSAAMPIIVLTASGGPEEWRRLSAMGADRLLVKPVVADDVVALVRRSLSERGGGALQVVA